MAKDKPTKKTAKTSPKKPAKPKPTKIVEPVAEPQAPTVKLVPDGFVVVDRKEQIAHDTKDWIRTAADEQAALAGMVFDGERGEYVCRWMEENCFLYEGIGAGKPIVLIPYQRDFAMRLYSWVYYSDEWKEYIRRFTRANLLCPKKNGKSPFLAANGIYLTCADGEQGQKVFTSAKNGKQAGITHQHAVNMVEQSPLLNSQKGGSCSINKATGAITHIETRSKMVILTGDDTHGAQANEGINGSILIDELHVFDREMAERVKRAGRSRKEPLNLAVSTAGDDPSSYGFERVDHGRNVNAGKVKDLHTLHVEYSAPQRATDADIAANVEEYTRQANPAIGYTVRMSELLQDYEDSKGKPREMARYKQHTLNIWVGSVHPWLNELAWAKRKGHFTLEAMRGRECRLGIDLSRTRDMTAVVFNFPMPDVSPSAMYLHPLFWLPHETAEKRKNLFPYLEWAEKGYLTLTEGNVVDYTAVEEQTIELATEWDLVITGIYFDQLFGEEITQRLADELNCERTAVSQSLMTLAPLCAEFERRIDMGAVYHDGNAVMDWQIGHCQVWVDRNQNMRPVKPEQDSGKSIDGIMATLDTMAGAVEDMGSEHGEPSVTFL